jgi:hypothetical protein
MQQEGVGVSKLENRLVASFNGLVLRTVSRLVVQNQTPRRPRSVAFSRIKDSASCPVEVSDTFHKIVA